MLFCVCGNCPNIPQGYGIATIATNTDHAKAFLNTVDQIGFTLF
jgi:hypothetical protein